MEKREDMLIFPQFCGTHRDGPFRRSCRPMAGFHRNLVACHPCTLRPRCTPEKTKRLKRWEHEDVLNAMQARLDQMPDAMLVRRRTVEHVFGTLKSWTRGAHILTKSLDKVRTEMSLSALAYISSCLSRRPTVPPSRGDAPICAGAIGRRNRAVPTCVHADRTLSGDKRMLTGTAADFFPSTPAKQLHIAAMALNRRPSTG